MSLQLNLSEEAYIRVILKIHYRTYLGKSLYVAGSVFTLGLWNPLNALRMKWNKDDYWTVEFQIYRYINEKIEYKYVINETNLNLNNSSPFWEPGSNRIITQYILENKQQSEYNIQEIWGYRTIKLKLNYNVQIDKEEMFVVGNIDELGNWKQPQKMQLTLKRDIISDDITQQWQYSFNVNQDTFSFRYKYVKKKSSDQSMIWERGIRRSLRAEDLPSLRSVSDQYRNQPIKIKAQMQTFIQLKEILSQSEQCIKTNGSFKREEESSFTEKKVKKKNKIEQEEQHNKLIQQEIQKFKKSEIKFYSYEIFGKINKIDWSFNSQFEFFKINEYITIGPYPQDEEDITILKKEGIRGVLNLQSRFDFTQYGINFEELKSIYKRNDMDIVNFEMIDMNSTDFIKKAYKAVNILKKLINSHEQIYVHCSAGISRAPSVVVLYLSTNLGYSIQEAIILVKQNRPQFIINYWMLNKALEKCQLFQSQLYKLENWLY